MRSRAGVCWLSSRQSGFVEGDDGTTSRRSCEVVFLTKSSPDHKLETASMSHTYGRRPPSRPRRLGESQSLRSRFADAEKMSRRPQCLISFEY